MTMTMQSALFFSSSLIYRFVFILFYLFIYFHIVAVDWNGTVKKDGTKRNQRISL